MFKYYSILFTWIACSSVPYPPPISEPSSSMLVPNTKHNPLGCEFELINPSNLTPGSVLLVHALCTNLNAKPLVQLNEKKILLFEASHKQSLVGKSFTGLVGIPMEIQLGKTILKGFGGESDPAVELEFNVLPDHYPAEKLTVDPKKVAPTDPKIIKRILHEQRLISAAYKRITYAYQATTGFIWPLNSKVVSVFGSKRIYNQKLSGYHGGIDLRAAEGTPIPSAANGTVALAADLFYTGKTVILNHGYGIITLYAHLSRIHVRKGQTVFQNQILGLSGKTGRVTGPHLHWQVVLNSVKVNPQDFLEALKNDIF